jgi:peptide/nickel transport system permease protein
MQMYVAKRMLAVAPVLLGVSILIFALVRIIPGDMATILAGEDATPELVEQIRTELGLDRPAIVQYTDWMGGILTGDFGTSLRTGLPVGPDIVRRLPVTIELTMLTMLFSLGIGIPAGIAAALRQDSWLDYTARLITVGGLSIPDFWTGLLLLLMPVIWFGWAPDLAYVPIWDDPFTNLQQFMFPAFAMGISLSSIVTRMVRSTLLEVLRSDYIRTARAKGISESRVVTRHALKNAFIPVMTILGLQLGRLLGGAVVLENIYGLPGLGRFAFASISERDFLMLQTIVLVFAAIYAFVNLTIDLTYAWLDPRIRYS